MWMCLRNIFDKKHSYQAQWTSDLLQPANIKTPCMLLQGTKSYPTEQTNLLLQSVHMKYTFWFKKTDYALYVPVFENQLI